jgi:transcriptional regulator with XRE-family HTH domain
VSTTAKYDGPNAVDLHVGVRIRLRRRELGISQGKLAKAIGVTFQQVQKYERGANRVSASKLWEIAQTLKTSIATFFEGLSGDQPSEPTAGQTQMREFQLLPESLEVIDLLPKLPRHQRTALMVLVRAMVEAEK